MNDLVVEKKEKKKQSLNTGQQNKTNKIKKEMELFLGDPNVF